MMDDVIDIKEILSLIPHRYPLLLVDRVINIEAGISIEGIKNVTINEPHFMGHFPGNPIMPGVLIIEALAQISALLVSKSLFSQHNHQDKEILFLSIENAKFRKIVTPGDTVHLHSKIQQNRHNVWKFASRAEVNSEIVTESNFTAMVKNK